jgi:hypothetical protein
MNPFCCCATSDVLKAIGLSLTDLFPEPLGHEFKPERRPFDALQVLEAVAHEISVTVLIAYDLARADEEQRERLLLAAKRLEAALGLVGDRPIPEEIKRIRRAEARPC